MAQKRSKVSGAAVPSERPPRSNGPPAAHVKRDEGSAANRWSYLFSEMACRTSQLAGKPLTFLVAVLLVVAWAATGPLFGYSDTGSSSSYIDDDRDVPDGLLIQHTQNRDTMALQLKLSELIIAAQGAENRLATAEDMSEEELERLHEAYRSRAEETLDHLTRRRGNLKRAG